MISLALLSFKFLKEKKYKLAYLFLGISTQIKMFPILFLPFFLKRNKKNIVYFLITFLIPLIAFFYSQNVLTSFLMHIVDSKDYTSIINNPLHFSFLFKEILNIPLFSLFFVIFFRNLFRDWKINKSYEAYTYFILIISFYFLGFLHGIFFGIFYQFS